MRVGPKLPRPSSTLPDRPFSALQRFRQLTEELRTCPLCEAIGKV